MRSKERLGRSNRVALQIEDKGHQVFLFFEDRVLQIRAKAPLELMHCLQRNAQSNLGQRIRLGSTASSKVRKDSIDFLFFFGSSFAPNLYFFLREHADRRLRLRICCDQQPE